MRTLLIFVFVYAVAIIPLVIVTCKRFKQLDDSTPRPPRETL